MKQHSNYHESDITIDNHAYKLKLIMNDQHLTITVTNTRSKSTFSNSYSHSEISTMTREAGFLSNMSQLYEMLIVGALTEPNNPKKQIDLDITMENTEDKQNQKMVLELTLTLDGELKRNYFYVFELLNVKRTICEILDEVLDDSDKLSSRVSQLEKLSDRVDRLEKLLESISPKSNRLVDTTKQSKQKSILDDCLPDNTSKDIYVTIKNVFQLDCQNGNLTCAKSLYSIHHIDIRADNELAFRLACRHGHLDVAKWLYSQDNVDIHVKDEYAFTVACENGHLAVAQWILGLGTSCSQPTCPSGTRYSIGEEKDRTNPSSPARKGQYRVDIHANDDYAFQLSCENGHLAVAQWLYSLGGVYIHADGECPFEMSCKNGHLALAQWLYSTGEIDIHANHECGFTWSCQNGHLTIAQWLYSIGGVDIHVSDEHPFRIACANGHLAVAQWLYSLGNVDIHAVSETAFKWSHKNGHLAVFQWLESIGK